MSLWSNGSSERSVFTQKEEVYAVHRKRKGSADSLQSLWERVPLVFLHGFSANAWLWAYQAPILAHKYHCVVIEARGHGLSSKPLTGYSIQDMAADDAAVLAALGIDRAILVGNSMGGMRAMQMSLDYPHLVAGNVIISSATNLHQTLDTAELIASFQNDYEAAADNLVTRCFSAKTRAERPEVCQMIKHNFLNEGGFPRRVALACLEDPNGVWQWDISDRLQEITQPTLVLVVRKTRRHQSRLIVFWPSIFPEPNCACSKRSATATRSNGRLNLTRCWRNLSRSMGTELGGRRIAVSGSSKKRFRLK